MSRSFAIAAGALALGLTTAAGVSGAATAPAPIRACASQADGAMRLLADGQRCKRSETPLRWNLQGPRGYTGATGPVGLTGPAGPAGDDGTTTIIREEAVMSFAPGGNGSNWADGPGAFAAATTTTQSTGFGVNAFGQVTSGANNTGVGYGAGRTVVTGYGNTALGTAAMYQAGSAAAFNVAIGLHAARYVTGDGNTIIGTDAGGNAGSVDETVVVGHNAYAGGTGRVALGSGASADHADSVAIGRNTRTIGAGQVSVGARDVAVTDPAKGIILTSPDGSRWRLTVGNDGALTTTLVS